MTITPPVQTLITAAEQAKALLANAADSRNFYNPYYDESHPPILHERDAATALYTAQAATANAMLAVVGELAELRAEIHQATALRSDLADIATAVRGLASALVATAVTQTADVARAVRELNTTLAEHMDEQTDQVEAVRDAVEEGLADVASVVELLVRPRGGWWSRLLLWWRRRPTAQVAAELIASAGKDGLVDEAPVSELSPRRDGGAA
jgi:hypothetical protein